MKTTDIPTMPPPAPPAATTPTTSKPAPLRRPAPEPRRQPLGPSGVLWRALAGLMILAGLLWGTYNVLTVLAHGERTDTEEFASADVQALDIDSANGSVRIIAGETSAISVRAEISDGLRRTGESRTIVDGVLGLHATCPSIGSDFCWVNYEVTVPRDLPITVRSDNGRIEITGSTGPIAVNGDSGSIMLTDVSGPLDVSTDAGRIEGVGLRSPTVVADSDHGRVELTFELAPNSVRATSNDGSVEVVVPDDATTYRVELNTDDGREELQVPTDPASTRSLVIETDNGAVTARTGP